jgi:hypothetical protein
VSVVDHHDRAIFFGKVAERGQRANVAIHGEHSVSDEEFASGIVLNAGQFFLRLRNIFVFINQNLCP